jgi:hypothetical protein
MRVHNVAFGGNEFPVSTVSSARTEEAHMQEAEKYRQFAKDCVRLAGKASASDKVVLLKIAEAWEQQATIADARNKKTDGC